MYPPRTRWRTACSPLDDVVGPHAGTLKPGPLRGPVFLREAGHHLVVTSARHGGCGNHGKVIREKPQKRVRSRPAGQPCPYIKPEIAKGISRSCGLVLPVQNSHTLPGFVRVLNSVTGSGLSVRLAELYKGARPGRLGRKCGDKRRF